MARNAAEIESITAPSAAPPGSEIKVEYRINKKKPVNILDPDRCDRKILEPPGVAVREMLFVNEAKVDEREFCVQGDGRDETIIFRTPAVEEVITFAIRLEGKSSGNVFDEKGGEIELSKTAPPTGEKPKGPSLTTLALGGLVVAGVGFVALNEILED